MCEEEKDLHLYRDERYQLGVKWCIDALQKFTNRNYAALDPRHMALKLAKNHLEDKGL